MKKLLTLAILFCMVLASACSEQTGPVTTDTAEAAVDTAEVDEIGITPDIPADLRYDGKTFRILATPDANYGPVLEDFELDKNADVLQQALYNRLIDTEDRFGISVELNYGVEREIINVSRSAINAGSDEFDMVADVAMWHRDAVYEGLYLPVSELTYVDLDKPWWGKSYIESVSVNSEKPYILFGSINLKSIERSVCTLFNIDMMRDVKGISEQEMYDMVLDDKWTLDKMIELVKDTYNDENGNTVADEGDVYGYAHTDGGQINWLAFSSGLSFTSRDENGYPVLTLNNERSVALTDKLIRLFKGEDAFSDPNQSVGVEVFSSGHALFYVNRFICLGWLRDSNVNYGILPPPKYDETIEEYYVAVAENTQWQMVPVTEPDPEFASAVIEYLAYAGHKDVIPAYYDITVKFKYTRGDLEGASQMLDIIMANQRNDFMSVNTLGGMESIFYEVVKSGNNTFSSRYASLESGAKYRLRQYASDLG